MKKTKPENWKKMIKNGLDDVNKLVTYKEFMSLMDNYNNVLTYEEIHYQGMKEATEKVKKKK